MSAGPGAEAAAAFRKVLAEQHAKKQKAAPKAPAKDTGSGSAPAA